MVVTSPVMTINKIERNAGTITSQTNSLDNVWGAYYDITPPTDVHDAVLILHASDDGSATWDTDTYTITFSATNSSQTRGDWKISKLFNSETIPTKEVVWTSDNDEEDIVFDSGDLNTDPDNVQSITGVALLDATEWESGSNNIFGFLIVIIDAMPTVTLTSMPVSGLFDNDVISFDSGDAGDTVTVNPDHPNYVGARIYNVIDEEQSNPTGSTFDIILTDGWYFILYIDMPYDNNATDIAIRRINMIQN